MFLNIQYKTDELFTDSFDELKGNVNVIKNLFKVLCHLIVKIFSV